MKLESLALSDQAGTAQFKVYKGENSHLNTLVTHTEVASDRGFDIVNVTTQTGDTYCSDNEIRHIHFLKVDVEGAEMRVFKDFETMLKEGRISCIKFGATPSNA